ncbi:hypothetical protein PO124_28140 [Bacillus licheniformis]|nr:hypothetical protein [Bacillus licheniformis]
MSKAWEKQTGSSTPLRSLTNKRAPAGTNRLRRLLFYEPFA